MNAVGFYEESGEDVKHLTHTTPEKLEGTVFTIEEETEIDLLNDVLPQGDILIKFTDDSVYLPDNESVSDSVNYLADNDWDSVIDIIYTGLSRGNTENAIVELASDDEEPEEAECGVDCDCFGFCAETGELV